MKIFILEYIGYSEPFQKKEDRKSPPCTLNSFFSKGDGNTVFSAGFEYWEITGITILLETRVSTF